MTLLDYWVKAIFEYFRKSLVCSHCTLKWEVAQEFCKNNVISFLLLCMTLNMNMTMISLQILVSNAVLWLVVLGPEGEEERVARELKPYNDS